MNDDKETFAEWLFYRRRNKPRRINKHTTNSSQKDNNDEQGTQN